MGAEKVGTALAVHFDSVQTERVHILFLLLGVRIWGMVAVGLISEQVVVAAHEQLGALRPYDEQGPMRGLVSVTLSVLHQQHSDVHLFYLL